MVQAATSNGQIELSHNGITVPALAQRSSEFEDICRLAADFCHTEFALLSFMDENGLWLKAYYGFDSAEIPQELGFCAEVVGSSDELLMVKNVSKDKRFNNNGSTGSASGIGFYAGVALKDEQGNVTGALCIADNTPGQLSDVQANTLKMLARQAERLRMAALNKLDLDAAKREEAVTKRIIEKMASLAAHDLRGPLHNIISLVQFYVDDNADKIDEDSMIYLNHVKTSSSKLSQLIDSLLQLEKQTRFSTSVYRHVDFSLLLKTIIEDIDVPVNVPINLAANIKDIYVSEVGLAQALRLLVMNSLLKLDEEDGVITVSIEESPEQYTIRLTDSSPSYMAEDNSILTDLFLALKADLYPEYVTRFAAAKMLAEKMGGGLTIVTNSSRGNTAIITVAKQEDFRTGNK